MTTLVYHGKSKCLLEYCNEKLAFSTRDNIFYLTFQNILVQSGSSVQAQGQGPWASCFLCTCGFGCRKKTLRPQKIIARSRISHIYHQTVQISISRTTRYHTRLQRKNTFGPQNTRATSRIFHTTRDTTRQYIVNNKISKTAFSTHQQFISKKKKPHRPSNYLKSKHKDASTCFLNTCKIPDSNCWINEILSFGDKVIPRLSSTVIFVRLNKVLQNILIWIQLDRFI